MKKILPFLLFLTIFGTAFSQKMLVLEKYGRAKTTRIYPGQNLSFKIKDQPGWYERELTDVLPDQKSVVLDLEIVKIADIESLRKRRRAGRFLGFNFLVFSANLALISGVAALRHDEVAPFWLPVGTATTVGGAFLVLRKWKHIPLGTKYNLRALDLTLPKTKQT